MVKRRRALVRPRMMRSSCLTDCGHRWWGGVWVLPEDAASMGNMVVARAMASPRMVCMYAARESTGSLPPNC